MTTKGDMQMRRIVATLGLAALLLGVPLTAQAAGGSTVSGGGTLISGSKIGLHVADDLTGKITYSSADGSVAVRCDGLSRFRAAEFKNFAIASFASRTCTDGDIVVIRALDRGEGSYNHDRVGIHVYDADRNLIVAEVASGLLDGNIQVTLG